MKNGAIALLALTFALPAAAGADEGMWTLDHFPAAKVAATYGFTPAPAFLDRVRQAAVRLPGCSGSFVSPSGLIMTNQHCARGCLAALSTPQQDYVATGFRAASAAEERACPGFQINVLAAIEHVTPAVKNATAGATGAAFATKQRAAFAKLEADCQRASGLQCQVVSLYHGGIYDLYKYRRYTDVRLVFAPELAIAYFGGDPDNFTYPRYDLDCAFLRAYEGGTPAATPNYFAWSAAGAKDGELVFVPGNPGSTGRLLTVAELEQLRDVTNPYVLRFFSEERGLLTRFVAESAEHARMATTILLGIENTLKGIQGREETLLDPAFLAEKVARERAERAAVARDPRLRARYGAAWDAIAKAEMRARELGTLYRWRETSGAPGAYLGNARTLVRAAAERAKPDAQRLREFDDAALPQLERRLGAAVPFYPELENVLLAFNLTKMREYLGADDPYVKAILGSETPQAVADRITAGTKLGDPQVRLALYRGGAAAVAASDDPAVVLMRNVDALARAARTQYDDEVTAVLRRNEELVAQADFALHGTSTYPDATFTLRLSYGSVKGYREHGQDIAPFTTVGGAYARATGAEPYALPKSWLDARAAVDPSTPLNFVTTNDIIGGNSGSPVINARAQIVGLIFDGNIESLGGDYAYDGRQNRSVAVHSAGLMQALRSIYHADRIADELAAAAK